MTVGDGKTGLVDPAVIGTTGILRAIKRSAPSVRRVVVTSSFAAILDGDKLDDPATTFTEASWNPAGLDRVSESLIVAYRVSKVLAERAAWDEAKEAAFDLVTVNPPLVFGPVAHHLAGGVSAINTSNQRVVDLLQGKWREQLPPTGLVSIWVDVRDVATAHVGALERPEAAGRRLFTVAGHFSNRQIADAARAYADANGFLAEYQDKLPAPDAPGGERPAEGEAFKWNADETNKLLGIKYITIEQSIGDLFKSLKEHGI
jgi:nucleoside-diphosphate-sugar epimerase